jgi:hypothetical protein
MQVRSNHYLITTLDAQRFDFFIDNKTWASLTVTMVSNNGTIEDLSQHKKYYCENFKTNEYFSNKNKGIIEFYNMSYR